MLLRKSHVFLLLFLIGISVTTPPVALDFSSVPQLSQESTFLPTFHDPVVIESDTDFVNQGWPGNGSMNNPFLIEDLEIELSDYSTCIDISHTSVNFEIRNCIFSYHYSKAYFGFYYQSLMGIGVQLDHVFNCTLVNCTFFNLETGIYAQSVTDSMFMNNTVRNCELGIHLALSETSIFNHNRVLFNYEGLWLAEISACTITENLVAYNKEFGIELSSGDSPNRVFNNTIGYNQEYLNEPEHNAQDYGDNNIWDDNISLGNAWSDYTGEGVYSIEGPANSVDRFPTIAHFDLAGPEIFFVTNLAITMTRGFCPFSKLSLGAEVRDQTGVDRVLLYYSNTSLYNAPPNETWTCVEMTCDSTGEFPERYGFTFEGPLYSLDFIRKYYVWANDSTGLSSTSEILQNTMLCNNRTSCTPGTCIIVPGVVIGMSAVIIFVWIKKERVD
jgi:parallel beta-helix repeat protein